MQIEPIFRSAPHGHSQKSKHPKSSHYRRGCSGKTGRSEKASRKKKVSPTVPTAVSALAPATVKPDAKAKPKANIAKPKTLPAANANAALSAEQRKNYVEVAAFYIAERRSFAPESPADDWIAAELEVDRLIASGHFNN